MLSELSLDDSQSDLLSRAIARLASKAPTRAKCIFLNCEIRDTANDIAISPDLFAVAKPLFGKSKRVNMEVNWEAADLLMSLGQDIMTKENIQHVIIDLIIDERGTYKAYRDDGALRRLAGGDGMYRSKHREYVEHEPWLAHL